MTAPRPIPITFHWNGEVMTPKQRWQASRQFESGHDYTLTIHEERSSASHSHLFAVLREAWSNLPEQYSKRFIDPEHLRRYALIKNGWAIERTVACESAATAQAVAAAAASLDESAVIIVQGTIVTIATARSQKMHGPGAMTKEEFQQSKQQVLEYIAGLLGVDVATLSSQVPHSSDAPSGDGARADAPAGNAGPQPQPAGVSYTGEASRLPVDWFDTYVKLLTKATNRAMSVVHRDEAALRQLGAVPNEWERDLQRRIATWVNKRDRSKVTAQAFHDGIAAIRAEWARAIEGEQAA